MSVDTNTVPAMRKILPKLYFQLIIIFQSTLKISLENLEYSTQIPTMYCCCMLDLGSELLQIHFPKWINNIIVNPEMIRILIVTKVVFSSF